jgi:Uma2 family endonuclease
MNVEEFFKLRESDPDHRYEYIDGEVYMIAGGTPNHSIIGSNVGRILGNLLENRSCIVYNSDVYVQLAENARVCPDVSVSCDPRDRKAPEAIQYPRVIVEVLSPGTEARDRGIKFAKYRTCPSIQEYLLINPERKEVELFRREKENLWTIWTFGPGDQIELTSLGVRFLAADIYKKVYFQEASYV